MDGWRCAWVVVVAALVAAMALIMSPPTHPPTIPQMSRLRCVQEQWRSILRRVWLSSCPSPFSLHPHDPSGGGARKCIGDQFAITEASVALITLLRRFRFRLPDPQGVRARDGGAG